MGAGVTCRPFRSRPDPTKCDRHGPPSGRGPQSECSPPASTCRRLLLPCQALQHASSCRCPCHAPCRLPPAQQRASHLQFKAAARRLAPAARRSPPSCRHHYTRASLPSPTPPPSQLDTLRQKRSALRARGDEVRGWAGSGGGGGQALPARALSARDATALAAAAQRRRAGAYAVSSSSSSSDAEEEGGARGSPAPTAAEATAKLFAKLGIKGGSGHDSDTSWASSPERGSIRAVHGNGGSGGSAASTSSPGEEDGSQLAAELARAQATIAALQQELAAARVQADDGTVALHAAEQRAAEAEVGAEFGGMGRAFCGLYLASVLCVTLTAPHACQDAQRAYQASLSSLPAALPQPHLSTSWR